ncbi:MAG: transcriptional regulator [Clostridium sp.]|jgi:LCP family protein required for cell wall assembly|nr:MAG: transcriptional regulator [Clostridium sp.]
MSTKGKRMANNSDNKKNINSEELYDNANSENYKYGAYERNKEREEEFNERKKKKMNKGLKIFLIILLILFIIVAGLGVAGYTFVNGKIGKMQKENIDTTAVGINEETKQELKGYRNIALLGIDSRADDYGLGNRSDCMMIASINQETNEIKLISVYRDTYVYVMENGTKRLDKITHAYSYGGAQNTLKSLNEAMDLNITEFVTVNFDAVIAAVDSLGGVYIDIDKSEIKYVNDYIDATSESSGVKSSHITHSGRQKLDGVQAVSYTRVRYTAGGDYKRTERMRTVVEAMLSKAKTLNVGQLNSFADTILPKIRTNISTSEIWGLIPKLASFKVTESIGWPYDTKGITLDRWYGVPVTLQSNVERLHKEAFEQEDYEASDTVKEMSAAIVKKTGYSK